MNLAEFSLKNRTTVLVLTASMLFGGMISFQGLARYEDPEFTIKEALVLTPYPGASPTQVELEVSDRIEKAIQELGQLEWIESTNYRGMSRVRARMLDQYDKNALPQVWDELRRKVGDIQGNLPPGAGPSVVNDDFGDVWGVFVAIHGDEYSYAELREVAKLLQRELLLVEDVRKIDFWGMQEEAVYVETDRDRMSQLGISPGRIVELLRARNVAADAGRAQVGTEFIAIHPSGEFMSVEAFEGLLLSEEGANEQIFLRDVANVRRGYVEPPSTLLRYDGEHAVGLGISTKVGGNVVKMGELIELRMRELSAQIPLGVEFGIISLQSDAVIQAIDGFMISLYEAVAIVIAVLVLFMGLRSSMIIGFVLAFTISGTFIFMGPTDTALERISLGALIIALGMLVDNAIVIVDGMLVRIQKGARAEDAAIEVVGQSALPLLGATAVAIMAFGAIGLSQDSTGEYCRSLFKVVMISLSLSWVTAMTTTPILCVMFLKAPEKEGDEETPEPYGGAFYNAYRLILGGAIRARYLTIAIVLTFFAASVYGFGYLDTSFFPDSTRPQFMVEFWMPQGTHIDDTVAEASKVEEYLAGLDHVTHVTMLAGAGGMRFLLTYTAEQNNSAYVQFIVDVDDYAIIEPLTHEVESNLAENFPDVMTYTKLFRLGPGDGGRVQAKIMGPDRHVVRSIAEQAYRIISAEPLAKGVRMDWMQQVKVIEPVIAEEEADVAGITRSEVAETVLAGFEGQQVGVYRERDEILPIIVRQPEPFRSEINSLQNLQIWSTAAACLIPFRQVISEFDTYFDDDIVMRMNRSKALTIHADPVDVPPSVMLEQVKAEVEALDFPPGYTVEWWGEYRDGNRATSAIFGSVPFFLLAMILIVVALFNDLRKPLAIFLCVPLALIGVTAGLLIANQPFGFMAMLGFLSLSGMLIKNAIVLIDEIEVQKKSKSVYDAIVTSGVNRLRPVAMAALTTALGMMPLVFDAFFVAMAVTVIFGLIVATLLTMIAVPVFYATFFGVKSP
ncbi:MAG: efflux RND transporter permease subunit [Deltaproteobacteria bacterium]|nr:efflux RND transporter permease subunit [Deltaproteobacteria bacterium]